MREEEFSAPAPGMNLESFLNAENKRELKLMFNCKDVKKSLSFLYYSKKNKEQKKFIQSIAKNHYQAKLKNS
jgi:hypothetical protein